jgi:ABC-type enterobactin transport system permease subunit
MRLFVETLPITFGCAVWLWVLRRRANPGRLRLVLVALGIGVVSSAVNGELLTAEAPLAVAFDSATALLGALGAYSVVHLLRRRANG